MKFYACSAGEPGKNYDQDNYDRIIKENAFIMDSGVTQRGYYDQVERGDILIIKYQRGAIQNYATHFFNMLVIISNFSLR